MLELMQFTSSRESKHSKYVANHSVLIGYSQCQPFRASFSLPILCICQYYVSIVFELYLSLMFSMQRILTIPMALELYIFRNQVVAIAKAILPSWLAYTALNRPVQAWKIGEEQWFTPSLDFYPAVLWHHLSRAWNAMILKVGKWKPPQISKTRLSRDQSHCSQT